MRHASLFSGIGAPELAAYWLGWENVFHCEINPFCRQVLNYWFTNSKSYEDITKTDFREWQGKIDVLTGDFHANRSVWPEREREQKITATSGRNLNVPYGKSDRLGLLVKMLLASYQWYNPARRLTWKVCRLRSMRINRSLSSKPSARTLKPKDILSNRLLYRLVPSVRPIEETESGSSLVTTASDYEKKKSEGKSDTDGRIPPYEFVADSHDCPTLRSTGKNEGKGTQKGIQERNDIQQSAKPACLWGTSSYSSSGRQFNWCSNRTERPLYHYEERDVSESESERFERKCRTWKDFPSDEHTDCIGLEGRLDKEKPLSPENESAWGNTCGLRYWEDFPTQPPICRGDDGISDLLDTDAIFKGSRSIRQNPYSRWRTEAIKAYGNAMVPQVIYQIYKTINEIEQ